MSNDSFTIDWFFLGVDPNPGGRGPVIIAREGGQVCGAFVERPILRFVTDEGLAYTDVVAWAPMPPHPHAKAKR